MEIKQYTQFAKRNPNWLPGKEAIAKVIKRCYGVTPRFIGIQEITSKNSALSGVFSCKTDSECVKLTTCGLSQITPNEYALGQRRSGWGAELTATLPEADITVGVKLLMQLAQYVNIRKAIFTEYSRVNLNRLKCGEPLFQSDIAGIVFIHDPELKSIETVHGSVDFLQIIGVDSSDWKTIRKTPALVRQYIYEVKKQNPNYCFRQAENPNTLE